MTLRAAALLNVNMAHVAQQRERLQSINELPQEAVTVPCLAPASSAKSYKSYCRSHAKIYPPDVALAQLEESASVSKTLHDLLSVLSLGEAEISSLWDERCVLSPHFKAAGELVLSSFQHRAALNGCKELVWVAHFLGTLSLGGHIPGSGLFAMDGDVALHGARAIPRTATSMWVRPDLSIGIRASYTEWDDLHAGKAILPLDVVEFKRDEADPEEGWYRLIYAAIVCAYNQLDLLDALQDAGSSSVTPQFSAAIPLALATLMNGDDFRMACVWHVPGRAGKAKDDGAEQFVLRPECQNWYHPRCVGLDVTKIGSTPWYCPGQHKRTTKPELLEQATSVASSSSSMPLRPIRQLFKVRRT